MMFDEITEIPRETYNEGPLKKSVNFVCLSIDKITAQVGVCFAMSWQDRQMPTSAQWDAARMRLLARVQSDREEADHCRLPERLHEVSLEDVPWPPYR